MEYIIIHKLYTKLVYRITDFILTKLVNKTMTSIIESLRNLGIKISKTRKAPRLDVDEESVIRGFGSDKNLLIADIAVNTKMDSRKVYIVLDTMREKNLVKMDGRASDLLQSVRLTPIGEKARKSAQISLKLR